ncbi:cytochrome c oxidase subunit NDUFA4-like [Ptychodera flava]|uniref:cytochrome c oxidase subunit NDUFA4-like n=1 Tax=Ptychodera flava TaxID=63121 RepID=UPI00396A0AE1
MQGFSLRTLKGHYSLVPLFACVGGGALFAAYYLLRLATTNPDATWNRSSNPYPWTKIKPNQQIKFYAAGKIDYANLKKRHPDYED